jgi:hypothetical protein
MYLDLVDRGSVSQAKMKPLVVRRSKAAATDHVTPLPYAAIGQVNCRAHGITRRPRSSDQLEPDPMVIVRTDIPQERGRSFQLIDDNVSFAIVKQVSEGCTSAYQSHS